MNIKRSIILAFCLFLLFKNKTMGETYNCAVFAFQNYSERGGLGAEITDKVISYLQSNYVGGHFYRPIERDRLGSIMAEQALSLTGAVSEASAVKVGNLAGAHIAVMGTVYSCSVNETNEFKAESKYEGQYAHRNVSIHIGCRFIWIATGQIISTLDGYGSSNSEGFTTWRSKRQTKDFGDALWKAVADNWIQNVTEPRPMADMIEEAKNIAVIRMFGGSYQSAPSSLGYSSSSSNDSPGATCFIATACYGSPMAKEVVVLQRFRDDFLLKSAVGRYFIKFYENLSPPIARWIEKDEKRKIITRVGLFPTVLCARLFIKTK